MEKAVVYAEGRFKTADGKVAHGLLRHSERFLVVAVIDSTLEAGADAGEVMDGLKRGVPIFHSLPEAVMAFNPETFIIGVVTEGGLLPEGYDAPIHWALENGLNVVSGLHQFISDNLELHDMAASRGKYIIDVRKRFRDRRRFFTGEVKDIGATRIATLGTDSAIGKRTTAVKIVEELRARGRKAEMIYTGQTGWMQGWKFGLVLDATINDFVAGGIEGAILDAWREEEPEFIIIEGQGSLVHPYFPGGYEILAAGQVHGFILIDAPRRKSLDGFPTYPMPDPARIVKIAEMICERPLVAVSINHENMTMEELPEVCASFEERFGVPAEDPVWGDVRRTVDALIDLRIKQLAEAPPVPSTSEMD